MPPEKAETMHFLFKFIDKSSTMNFSMRRQKCAHLGGRSCKVSGMFKGTLVISDGNFELLEELVDVFDHVFTLFWRCIGNA